MSLQLFVNRDYENNLIYFFNGRYYDAITLTPYQFPQGSSSARLMKLVEWSPEQIQAVPSRPLYVLTHNKWIILGAQADKSLLVIAQSGPIDNDERVVDATIFKLPNVQDVEFFLPEQQNSASAERNLLGTRPNQDQASPGLPESDQEGLSELPRRDFPMEIYERFVFLVNNGMQLSEFNNAVPTLGIHPEDIPQVIPGLPGGSVGLSDLVTSGGHVNPYAAEHFVTLPPRWSTPVTIRPSAETAMSPPGSPLYDGAFNEAQRSPSPISSLPLSQIQQGHPSSPLRTAQSRTGMTLEPISFNLSPAPQGDLRMEEIERSSFSPMSSEPSRINASPKSSFSDDTLVQKSYETLMQQLYGISVNLPASLTVNGLVTEFIDINRAGQLLQNNQIERFVLDPLLQPWAGHHSLPNRIITLFGKNGVNYLVKAQYNSTNGQIHGPI